MTCDPTACRHSPGPVSGLTAGSIDPGSATFPARHASGHVANPCRPNLHAAYRCGGSAGITPASRFIAVSRDTRGGARITHFGVANRARRMPANPLISQDNHILR